MTMGVLSILDTILFGIRRIYKGDGTEMPERPSITLSGAGVTTTDDPTNNTTLIEIDAALGAVPNTRKITVAVGSGLAISPSDGVLDEDLELDFDGLQDDGQHGNRGGGDLHDVATTEGAGFMSATDKTKLDGYPDYADMATKTYVDDAIAGLSGGVSGVETQGSPIVVDSTDPTTPKVGWDPSDDVPLNGYKLTALAGATNPDGDITLTPKSDSDVVAQKDALGTTYDSVIAARNATAATSLAAVQNGPILASEGAAWRTSGGGASVAVQGGLIAVPVSGSSVQIRLYPAYNIGSGWALGGEYYTTMDPYLFGYGRVQDTLILTPGGSGVRWSDAGNPGLRRNGNHVQFTAGGTNNVSLATNSTDRHLIDGSTADVTKTFNSTSAEVEDWGASGVNRTITTKRVVTTTDATTTNAYTYSMADNSALCWEIKVYCYQTGNPSFRAWFHRYAYFNRNSGAPTKDEEQPVVTDKVVGGWGTPPAVAITGGAPTTNDVSVQLTGVGATSIKWFVRVTPLDVMTTAA